MLFEIYIAETTFDAFIKVPKSNNVSWSSRILKRAISFAKKLFASFVQSWKFYDHYFGSNNCKTRAYFYKPISRIFFYIILLDSYDSAGIFELALWSTNLENFILQKSTQEPISVPDISGGRRTPKTEWSVPNLFYNIILE